MFEYQRVSGSEAMIAVVIGSINLYLSALDSFSDGEVL